MIKKEDIEKIVNSHVWDRKKIILEHLEDELYKKYSETDIFNHEEIRSIFEKILFDNNYVREEHSHYFVYIEPCIDDSWYKPEKIGEPYHTQIPTSLLVNRLDEFAKKRVFDPTYLPERSKSIRQSLEKGTNPSNFIPIRVVYNLDENIFSISDGIHRIQVFYEKEIPYINSELTIQRNIYNP